MSSNISIFAIIKNLKKLKKRLIYYKQNMGFIKGQVYNDEYYYCDITLNVGMINCGKTEVNAIALNVSNNLNECIFLNPIMFIKKKMNIYKLYVEGPDGGIYFETDTDLTDNEIDEMIAYFKSI